MKEGNLSWSDWYNKRIKNGSKSLQEELDKCKSMLEDFWQILTQISDLKPLYMEELLEDLKEENITESQIEEALDDLICGTNFIFPLRDAIKLYIKWKERVDFEKIDAAFCALAKLIVAEPPLNKIDEKLAELLDKSEAGELSDEENALLNKLIKDAFCRIKLKILPYHLFCAMQMLEGVVSSALLGNVIIAVILRPGIETFLRGAILEHILKYEFREDVNKMFRSGKRFDTVTFF